MNSFTSSLNQRLHLDIDRASGVVGSLVSFGRSQTFLSGSNLASTPGTGNPFFGRDDEEYAGEDEGGVPEEDEMEEIDDEEHHPPIAERDPEWDADRDRLIRAHAHEDEEFVVGSTNWDEDDADTPTSTLGPTTMPFASRPRTHSRPGSYRQPSRMRHISTPTIPSSSVRASRGRTSPSSTSASRGEARRGGAATGGGGSSGGGTPSRMSPPMAAVVEGRPSSAPVAPRFVMPPQVRQVDMDERTPLIRISGTSSPTRYDGSAPVTPSTLAPSPTHLQPQPHPKVVIPHHQPPQQPRQPDRKRRSSVKRPHLPPGRSTYGQTVRALSYLLIE